VPYPIIPVLFCCYPVEKYQKEIRIFSFKIKTKTNSMRKIIYSVFAGVLMFAGSNAFSQGMTMVMKAMDGTTKLNGESIVAGHTNEIDILSYSEGVSGCPTCKASISDFSFMTTFTGATIAFKRLSLTGGALTSVDITIQRSGITKPFVFLQMHMENVFVTSEQESGSEGGDSRPIVSVSLSAERIAWQYTQQKPDGTVGAKTSYGWDVAGNVPWKFF
jgi:type VI protein secretion system component Hcp